MMFMMILWWHIETTHGITAISVGCVLPPCFLHNLIPKETLAYCNKKINKHFNIYRRRCHLSIFVVRRAWFWSIYLTTNWPRQNCISNVFWCHNKIYGETWSNIKQCLIVSGGFHCRRWIIIILAQWKSYGNNSTALNGIGRGNSGYSLQNCDIPELKTYNVVPL